MAEIRPFSPADAEEVSELLADLLPVTLNTPESLRWREGAEPGRRSWVARDGDDLVGFGVSFLHVWIAERDKHRIWVGVREDFRRRGIGTALYEQAVQHAEGARAYTTEVEGEGAGLAFAERLGFAQYDSEIMSRLDPAACTLEPKPHEGYRAVPLRELRGRVTDLYEFYAAAGAIPPGAPVTLELFRELILGNPMLDPATSVVVLDDDDRIVSLSWLLVDPARDRAENEWTATLPELRGRGLARFAKLESIHLAAEHGIGEILTGNAPGNAPMRALNERLGYEPLYTRIDLERPA